MDIKVNVDAKDINREITQAVAKSAIGKELKRVIDEEVKRLSTSYDNPIKPVVRGEILTIIRELLQKQYLSQIREFVRDKMTDKFLEDLLGKLWEKFIERY